MSFRNAMTEEEKKMDDERKTVFSSSVPSTAVFKFGPVYHPIGKPLTRSQVKVNHDYDVVQQVAKLRRVVERDKERHDVEPDVGEPVVVEPSDVVDVDSDDKQ